MGRRKLTARLQNNVNSNRIRSVSARMGEVDQEFQNLHQHLDQIRQERNDTVSQNQDQYRTHVEESFNSFHDRLQAIDYQANQAIYAQSNYFKAQMDTYQAEVWDQVANELDQHIAWMEDEVTAEQAFQVDTINNLQQSIANNHQDALRRHEIAWQSLEIALEFFNFLNTHYINEHGWQSEASGIHSRLQQAYTNLENGFDEASLAGSQQVHQHLLELRTNLDIYILNRRDAISSALVSANGVMELLHQNDRVQAIDLQGVLLSKELEVDYWSSGLLRPLLRQTRSIIHHLQSPPFKLEMHEIHNLVERLASISEQIPIIVLEARIQLLSSQLRYSIAECILEALHSQGYEIYFGGFTESDMRNPYYMSMGNIAGSQVFVTISQIPQHPLSHNLALERCDPQALSEYEQRQRSREIESALGLYGLKVGLNQGPDSVFNTETQGYRSNSSPNWMPIPSPKPSSIEIQSHIR